MHMALVIADNEVDLLARADPMRSRNASYARATAALALSHLRAYEGQPEVLEAVCAEALGNESAQARVSSGATTPEWECGHLLACVARGRRRGQRRGNLQQGRLRNTRRRPTSATSEDAPRLTSRGSRTAATVRASRASMPTGE